MRLISERIGVMVQYKIKGKRHGGPRKLIFAVPMLYYAMDRPPGVLQDPIAGYGYKHILMAKFGGTYVIRRGAVPIVTKKYPVRTMVDLPEYLKSFSPDGSMIRQAYENPNNLTWFALTENNNLFEIDRE